MINEEVFLSSLNERFKDGNMESPWDDIEQPIPVFMSLEQFNSFFMENLIPFNYFLDADPEFAGLHHVSGIDLPPSDFVESMLVNMLFSRKGKETWNITDATYGFPLLHREEIDMLIGELEAALLKVQNIDMRAMDRNEITNFKLLRKCLEALVPSIKEGIETGFGDALSLYF
jgi:hypothetical protein